MTQEIDCNKNKDGDNYGAESSFPQMIDTATSAVKTITSGWKPIVFVIKFIKWL